MGLCRITRSAQPGSDIVQPRNRPLYAFRSVDARAHDAGSACSNDGISLLTAEMADQLDMR